jgi:myo-inositol 2-dehydrogenase/D-chiro-inositol 1-dehydrogenase
MKVLITEGDLIPRSFNIKMNRGELQKPPWISDSKLTGGFLFESTLHLIDIVCYLFGDVDRITAVGTKSVYPCVDDFSMLFEMKNGCHGVFSSSAHSTWVFPFERVEIYGEHISIFNDEMEAVTYCLGLNVPVEKRDFSTLPIEERWGYTQEDQVFVNRILGLDSDNNNLVATHIEGFKNVEIIESIYDQIGLDR